MPVFQIRVFFHFVQEQPGGEWTTSPRGGPVERFLVIAPAAERFMRIPAEIKNMIDRCDDQVYVTSIEFSDAAGRRWERDARGALKALS